MANQKIQAAVENWYMSGAHFGSSSYFMLDGKKYVILPRYGVSNKEYNKEYDVFEVKTFYIGNAEFEYPHYNEAREPISRIAVVTIPDELINEMSARRAEAKTHSTELFDEFFS